MRGGDLGQGSKTNTKTTIITQQLHKQNTSEQLTADSWASLGFCVSGLMPFWVKGRKKCTDDSKDVDVLVHTNSNRDICWCTHPVKASLCGLFLAGSAESHNEKKKFRLLELRPPLTFTCDAAFDQSADREDDQWGRHHGWRKAGTVSKRRSESEGRSYRAKTGRGGGSRVAAIQVSCLIL